MIDSLLNPSSFPEETAEVRLLQTHVSWLFVTERYVYKVKKPVSFGFLDFSSLERRRHYCFEEVRLNARLSPDIYLGVVEINDTPRGPAFEGAGPVLDYAVKMKRLPADGMLDRLLEHGGLSECDIAELARVIVRFHSGAATGERIAAWGTPAAVGTVIAENLEECSRIAGSTFTGGDVEELRAWTVSFLRQNRALFEGRHRSGCIREGDGDLHLGNICLDGTFRIFDCIEFSERFRYIDTASDIAFLLMDLEFRGAASLARRFLQEYRKASGDRVPDELLLYYKCHRAAVRAKVETLQALDPAVPQAEREDAAAAAVRHMRLARGYAVRHCLPPSLFLICGLTGSGKSTLAAELAWVLGAEVISSDVVRKRMAGLAPTDRGNDGYTMGIYSDEATESVYGSLFDQTERRLREERTVIVDATFRSEEQRDRFRRLAAGLALPFRVLYCTCPRNAARQRLEERQRRGDSVSDGTFDIYCQQESEFQEPLPAEDVIVVDTSLPPAQNARMIEEKVGMRCRTD